MELLKHTFFRVFFHVTPTPANAPGNENTSKRLAHPPWAARAEEDPGFSERVHAPGAGETQGQKPVGLREQEGNLVSSSASAGCRAQTESWSSEGSGSRSLEDAVGALRQDLSGFLRRKP